MKLARFERRWAGTIGRALLPVGALGGATDARDLGAEYARHFDLAPWWTALLLRYALWLIWLSPVWRSASPRTFGSLDLAAREACLEALLSARSYAVRETLTVVKLTYCFGAIGDRQVLASLGAYHLDREAGPQRSAS